MRPLFSAARTLVAFLLVVALAECAQADIILGNFGSTGPNTIRRYRESDSAFMGIVGSFGESNEGMTLGPDGKLYVVSNNLGTGDVARFDPVTGANMGTLVSPGSTYQIPHGAIFGADGNFYSTSQQFTTGVAGAVRFNGTTGAFMGVVVPPGNNGLGTPYDIDRMPSGDLLVSDGTRINRYDKTTFAFISTFVAPGSGGLTGIREFTYGPDGNLYISPSSQNQVLRFDGNTGAFLNVFVPSINRPAGMTFGNDGNFYVVSAPAINNVSVLRYNGTTGAFIDTFLAPSANYPTGFYLLTAPNVPEPATLAICGAAFIAVARRRR